MEKTELTVQERITLLNMAQVAVGYGNPDSEQIVKIAKDFEAYVSIDQSRTIGEG